MIREISSIKDEAILEARRLNAAVGRREVQKCLLEGEQIIAWALSSGWLVERVFFAKNNEKTSFIEALTEKHIPCYAVSEGILKKISDTNYIVPFIGVAKTPPDVEMDADFVIVLDDIRDFGNLGTIVRTASAFDIRDICTTSLETDIYYRKIIESSRGTVFKVKLKKYPSAMEAIVDLKTKGYMIIATSPHAKELQSSLKIDKNRLALIVGNETNGVSQQVLENADIVVQIPMANAVESLNVGVAAGISLYELKIKQVLLMLKTYIQRTLGREINVTGKLIQQAFNQSLQAETHYNSNQIIFLMVLRCDLAITRDQISKDLALFDDELEEMLAPLLSERMINEDGTQTMRLTEEGERFLAQIWGKVDTIEKDIFNDFTPTERDRFLDDLKRIQNRCIELIGNAHKGTQ